MTVSQSGILADVRAAQLLQGILYPAPIVRRSLVAALLVLGGPFALLRPALWHHGLHKACAHEFELRPRSSACLLEDFAGAIDVGGADAIGSLAISICAKQRDLSFMQKPREKLGGFHN